MGLQKVQNYLMINKYFTVETQIKITQQLTVPGCERTELTICPPVYIFTIRESSTIGPLPSEYPH